MILLIFNNELLCHPINDIYGQHDSFVNIAAAFKTISGIVR